MMFKYPDHSAPKSGLMFATVVAGLYSLVWD
jgi:hypothetical protein